jgi:hypothetical protein
MTPPMHQRILRRILAFGMRGLVGRMGSENGVASGAGNARPKSLPGGKARGEALLRRTPSSRRPRESTARRTEQDGSERKVKPMNCSQCGETLFSALERTRGVCASCFLYYKPEEKTELTGRAPQPVTQASQSDPGESRASEMEGSGQSGEATA